MTTTEEYRTGGERRTRTVTLRRLDGASFVLRDPSGAVHVDGTSLEWHDLRPSVDTSTRRLPGGPRHSQVATAGHLLQQLGIGGLPDLDPLGPGGGKDYRLIEHLVAPGTPVMVVGDLRAGPQGVLLAGAVMASTESPQEVEADQRAGAGGAVRVAQVAGAVGVLAAIGSLLG